MIGFTGVVEPPMLTDGVLVLRPPLPSDRADRQAYGSHPGIARMYGIDLDAPRGMSDEAADHWYQRVRDDPLAWVIAVQGRCVGVARLHSVVQRDRRARYAIGLFHPDFLGQGIGTRATRLVLSYAFDQMQLHRVDLRVLTYNARALDCYRRCGFVEEVRTWTWTRPAPSSMAAMAATRSRSSSHFTRARKS